MSSVEAKAAENSVSAPSDPTGPVSDPSAVSTKIEVSDNSMGVLSPESGDALKNEGTSGENLLSDVEIPPAPDMDADTFQKLDFLLERTKTFVRFIDDAHATDGAAAEAAADGTQPPLAKRTPGAEGEATKESKDAASCAAAATAAAAGKLSAEPVAPHEQPKYVPFPIRRYQLDAVNWLESLYLNGFNGILADEMGLGKTVTTVSFFCRLWENRIFGPFLVVAPVSTLQNWMNEITKWSGGTIPAILYHGTKEQRAALAASGRLQKCIQRAEAGKKVGEKGGCCVVTSFDIAMNDLKVLRKIAWQYVVVDEAHRLKNMHCKLICDMRRLNTEYRLLLTGTPLQNNIAELWSLLNFILPTIFDDLAQFQKWFDLDSMVEDEDEGEGEGDEEGYGAAERKGDKAQQSGDTKEDGEDGAEDLKRGGGRGRGRGRGETTKPPSGGWRSFAQRKDGGDGEDGGDGGGRTSAVVGGTPTVRKPPTSSRKTTLQSEQQTKILLKLHEILRPFVLRRLKSEVGLGLPQKREIALYCDATAGQHAAMKALMDGKFEDYAAKVSASFGRGGTEGVCTSRERFNNVLMQMRKVCNHLFLFPALNPFADHVLRHAEETAFDPGSDEDDLRALTSQANRSLRLVTMRDEVVDGLSWDDPAQRAAYDAALIAESGKFRLLAEMLPVLRKAGHRVLIFSQMVTMLDLIEDHLSLREYSFRRLDGSVPQVERQIRIEAFNHDTSIFCFLLSTRAGGLGVNLTGADTVIIYDSDWNPQMDLQAQDRVHRIGQTRPVAVYRLLTANSVESYLMHKATQKLRLEHLVIEKGNFNRSRRGKMFSAKDLADVLTLRGGDGEVHLGDVAIDNDTLAKVLDRDYVCQMVDQVSREEDSSKAEEQELTVAAVAAGILSKGGEDAEDKALRALEAAEKSKSSDDTRGAGGGGSQPRHGFEIVRDLASGF